MDSKNKNHLTVAFLDPEGLEERDTLHPHPHPPMTIRGEAQRGTSLCVRGWGWGVGVLGKRER